MSEVKIKKVKPYPIPMQLQGKGAPIAGQIIKLLLQGFMADMQSHVIKVGEVLQVTFELPVLKVSIQQSVKVMKTYDRPNVQTHTIDRLAEFHFVAISDLDRANILKFLQAIRQQDYA